MFRKPQCLFAVTAAALILAQFLYDPLSFLKQALEVENVRGQFIESKAQWDAAAVGDYSFVISGGSKSICAVNAAIEVQNGAVVNVTLLEAPASLPHKKWADPDWGDEAFLCDYDHFTFSRIFETLRKTLQNSPSSVLKIEFNRQFGFVAHYQEGLLTGHGRLAPAINAVYNEFWIMDFQKR